VRLIIELAFSHCDRSAICWTALSGQALKAATRRADGAGLGDGECAEAIIHVAPSADRIQHCQRNRVPNFTHGLVGGAATLHPAVSPCRARAADLLVSKIMEIGMTNARTFYHDLSMDLAAEVGDSVSSLSFVASLVEPFYHLQLFRLSDSRMTRQSSDRRTLKRVVGPLRCLVLRYVSI
jgi:hypothetical protein